MLRALSPIAALTYTLVLAAGQAEAVASKDPESRPPLPFLSLPGGVADPEGKTGYLANPQGGIDAVDLARGKLLWDTKAGSTLLAFADNRLIAQAGVEGKGNQIRLVVLDTTNKGKLLLASKPVVFPEWVSVGVTHGRSFSAGARIIKNNLLLTWEARAWYAGGARPTPQIEKAARRHASGVAQIDLKNGRVEMLSRDKVPPTPGPKLPRELEDVKSMQYWTGSSWETKPIIVGQKVAAITVENAKGKSALRLKTWDLSSAKVLSDGIVLEGKSLWPQLSADRRYLLVHQALPKESLPKGDYAWWIFSVATGKQVGKIPFEAGTREITLVGPRVYFMTEVTRGGPRGFTRSRLLKAITLKTGQFAWQRQIWAPPPLLPLP
jgi:hypothetical protein